MDIKIEDIKHAWLSRDIPLFELELMLIGRWIWSDEGNADTGNVEYLYLNDDVVTCELLDKDENSLATLGDNYCTWRVDHEEE